MLFIYSLKNKNMNKKIWWIVGVVVVLAVAAVMIFGNVPANDATGRVSKSLNDSSKVKSVSKVGKSSETKMYVAESSKIFDLSGVRSGKFDNLKNAVIMNAAPSNDEGETFEEYEARWIWECQTSQDLADAFNNGVFYTLEECVDQFNSMMTPSHGEIADACISNNCQSANDCRPSNYAQMSSAAQASIDSGCSAAFQSCVNGCIAGESSSTGG